MGELHQADLQIGSDGGERALVVITDLVATDGESLGERAHEAVLDAFADLDGVTVGER